MIAVCLQTCDRPALTERTAASFAALNDRSQFLLLHGDDASTDDQNRRIAQAYGFRTVIHTQQRVGISMVRGALFQVAAEHRCPWVLLLENDIESVRAFPWALFRFVAKVPQIYCLRLFGRFKDAAQTDACKTTHQWQENRPVSWKPMKRAPEPAQVGRIHWTGQPAVTRTAMAVAIHLVGARPNALTARVRDNVMVHIGAERTPGRVL